MQATLEAIYADESEKAILVPLVMHGTKDKQEQQAVFHRGRDAAHRRRSSAAALGRLASYKRALLLQSSLLSRRPQPMAEAARLMT